MYIKSAEFLDNYRQFKKGNVISFSKNMNVLVGPNGIGKTTIIRAIYEFLENQFLENNYYAKPPMKIVFRDVGKRMKDIFSGYLKECRIDVYDKLYEKSIFKNIFMFFENQNNSTYVTIDNNDLLINGNDFKFIFEEKETKQNHEKVCNTNRIIENFSNKLYKLFIESLNVVMINDNDHSFKYMMNTFDLYNDGSLQCDYSQLKTKQLEKYSYDYLVKSTLYFNDDIREYVRNEYLKITGKKFICKFHENIKKNFDQRAYTICQMSNTKFYNSHKNDKNIDKEYTECSSGEIDLINFLTLTSENENVDILLIDEPGKSLSQNYLQQAVSTLNNESQIIMVTHNPKIINKECIRNKNTTFIYFSKKYNKIECINVKEEMDKSNISYDILVNNGGVLFVDKCVCVEGISDYKVIRHFVQERHIEIMNGGDSKLKDLLERLGIEYWIIYDLDKLCDENGKKIFNDMKANDVKKVVRDRGSIIYNNYEIVKFEDKKILGFANKNFKSKLNDDNIKYIKNLLKNNIDNCVKRYDNKSLLVFFNKDYDEIQELKNMETPMNHDEYTNVYNRVNNKNNIYYHNIQYVDIEGYFDDIDKRELQNKSDDEIKSMIENNEDKFKDLCNFLNNISNDNNDVNKIELQNKSGDENNQDKYNDSNNFEKKYKEMNPNKLNNNKIEKIK